MALSDPKSVFTSRTTQREQREREQKKFRLQQHHIEDLQDVARGVEETNVGVCCKYLIDSRSGEGADYDETVLNAIEQFCQRNVIWEDPTIMTWRRRIERSRRALQKMYQEREDRHVAILHIVYGYPDPSIRNLPKYLLDDLLESASLVRYTSIVETHRLEMARQEGLRRSHQYGYQGLSREELHADAFRHNMNPVYFAPVIDILHTKDRIRWADQATSSGDAIRAMFAPIHERFQTESKDHYKVRKENVELKRDALALQIKMEVRKMLENASKRYHQAWVKSLTS